MTTDTSGCRPIIIGTVAVLLIILFISAYVGIKDQKKEKMDQNRSIGIQITNLIDEDNLLRHYIQHGGDTLWYNYVHEDIIRQKDSLYKLLK